MVERTDISVGCRVKEKDLAQGQERNLYLARYLELRVRDKRFFEKGMKDDPEKFCMQLAVGWRV